MAVPVQYVSLMPYAIFLLDYDSCRNDGAEMTETVISRDQNATVGI